MEGENKTGDMGGGGESGRWGGARTCPGTAMRMERR